MSRRIALPEALEVGDVVETDFGGRVTRHTVIARFKTRNSQTGVTYKVAPEVPRSSGPNSKIDHDWFKRVGNLEFDESDNLKIAPEKMQ